LIPKIEEVTGLPLKTNSVNMSIRKPIIAALPLTSSALLLNPKTFSTSSPLLFTHFEYSLSVDNLLVNHHFDFPLESPFLA